MRISVLLIGFLCFISGCKDWEYPQTFPIVLTEEVINIGSEGAEFIGSVESLGSSQNIINYGFAWSESEMPTINLSHVAFSDGISKGAFFKTINSDLIEGSVYYVRAFIQTDKLLIYGNQVTFTSQGSLPPTIIDFAPKEGFDGTEITLEGENFSSRIEGNIVKIGTLTCQVILATDSLLKIKSPVTNLVGDYKISITVAGKTSLSNSEYSILGPRINSISKLSGRVGDLLTIEGEYFDIGNYMSIYFGDPGQWITNESYPYVLSANEIECYVPDYPNTTGNVQLYSYANSGQKKFVFPDNFTILNSWEKISNTTPLEVYRDVVRFSSTVIGNSIFVIGGNSLYEFNTVALTWTKKQDFPGNYRYYGTSFAFNGKVYYGFGEGYYPAPSCCNNGQYFNDLWQYDPVTDTWTFLQNAPFEPRSRMVQFVIGNTAYLGFGWVSWPSVKSFDDLWSYNIETSTWTQINVPVSINSNYVSSATSFSVNSKGYIVGLSSGSNSTSWRSLWEFDPAISSWTQKADYPDDIYGENATTIGNHGLVIKSAINGIQTRVYEYDPMKNRWIKRQSMSQTSAPIQFAHYVNGALYYSSGNVWKLNFN